MLEIQQKDNMKEYINNFEKCVLFKGIESSQLLPMLNCLEAKIKECKKGQSVFQNGKTFKKNGSCEWEMDSTAEKL